MPDKWIASFGTLTRETKSRHSTVETPPSWRSGIAVLIKIPEIADAEEAFWLVFTLDRQDELYHWFKFVRSHVRRVKGVVHRLTRYCPGKVDSFRHVLGLATRLCAGHSLKNALRKVDAHRN
jgi:hypothetical protein